MTFGQKVIDCFVNYVDARWSSVEVDVGLGEGLGVEILGLKLRQYRDFYIGLDNGKIHTGTKIVESIGPYEHSYIHWSQKDGVWDPCYICYTNSEIRNCDHSEEVTSFTLFNYFTKNRGGNASVGISGSFHALFGGHFSIGVNYGEYLERLRD